MLPAGPATSGQLEFHAFEDDAWYNVLVKLEGDDVLRISYCEFTEEFDKVFNADDFQSLSEVDDLESRFRPLSVQLQDSECRRVDPGMAVCASYSPEPNDVRFYDAIVEGVDYLEHSYANGEEECLCNFILFWQHGPNSGNLTVAGIANICQIQSGSLDDAVLATFFRKVRHKIEIRLRKGDSSSEGQSLTHNCGTCHEESCSPKFKRRLSHFQYKNQEKRCPKSSLNKIVPYEGQRTLGKIIEQDTDIGGMKYQYMILLENLDKGLSPLRLAKFLHAKTTMLPRVYIFPSLASESYARGVVVLNCRNNLDRLHDFLNSPDHVIVSSRGRPLVVTGKMTRLDTFGELAGAMVLETDNQIWNQNDGSIRCELKVVGQGTHEYIVAKQMKELFMEFVSHQRRLHHRLAMEESKLSCSIPLLK